MKNIFSSILIIVISISLNAQVTFQKTIGGAFDDEAWCIQQTTDQGYILCGNSKSFNNNTDKDAYVVKTDVNGNVVWSNTYGGASDQQLYYIIQTADGGYIAIGDDFSTGTSLVYVLRVDSNGNVIWSKYLDNFWGTGFSVRQTQDNNFVIAGRINLHPNQDAFVAKLDINGNILWQNTYGDGVNNDFGQIEEMPNGDLICAGSSSGGGGLTTNGSGTHDNIIFKLDSDGNLLNALETGSTSNDGIRSITISPAGDIYIAGNSDLSGANQVAIHKINSSMTGAEWTTLIGKPGNSNPMRSWSTEITNNNQLISALAYAAVVQSSDAHIVLMDTTGVILWSKTYGGIDIDEVKSCNDAQDGGYFAAGYTSSFGAGGLDIYLMKTDANGDISSSSCDPIIFDPVISNPTFANANNSPSLTNKTVSEVDNNYTANPLPILEGLTCPDPCTITVTPDTTICNGSSATLVTQGANSYTWSPTTGLNTSNGDTVTANPIITTTYTIIGFTSCGNDTVTTTVTVQNTPTITATSAIICEESCTPNTWESMPSATYNHLIDLEMLDDCIGYAVGYNGTITKTEDGGDTWISKNIGTSSSLSDIKFSNTTTGYIVGANNSILKTADGGNTWVNTAPTQTSASRFNNHWVFDNNTIIASGDAGVNNPTLIKSNDGGVTWTIIDITIAGSTIYGIHFTDDLNGYIGTNYGDILKTTDGGLTWTTVFDSPSNNAGSIQIQSIHFTDSNTGFATGGRTPGRGEILKTTDAGLTWSSIYTNDNLYFSDIEFESSLIGYASGGNIGANTGTLVKTSDGGNTWNEINTNSTRLVKGNYNKVNAQFAVGSDGAIIKKCNNGIVRLKASGADSYLWSNGDTGSIISVNPTTITTTTNYTVTGTNQCGSSTAVSTIEVPVLTINNDTSICEGASILLTANGGADFEWSTGDTSQSITATPTLDTTYYLVSSTFGCCLKQDSVRITFTMGEPVLSVNTETICIGSSATLTAQGANTYTWSPATGLNTSTGNTVTANPTVTTTYTIIGSTYCGNDTTTTTVIVQDVPTVTASPVIICEGSADTLTAIGTGGVDIYIWSPVTDLTTLSDSSVLASPLVNTTYTVTVVNTCGSATATSNMTVKPAPIITANSEYICSGNSTTLIASGAVSYQWSPAIGLSSTSGNTITANPTTTTAYLIYGTAANNCSNSTSVDVTVSTPANISVNNDTLIICSGDSVNLSAQGPQAYIWSPAASLNNATSQNPIAFPLSTTTYTVSGNDGCPTTEAYTTVKVLPLPTAELSGKDWGCEELDVIFKGSGGDAPYTFTYTINGDKRTIRNDSLSDSLRFYQENLEGGIYTLKLTNVTDDNNCSSEELSEELPIRVVMNPIANFTVDPAKTSHFDPVINIEDASLYTYGWQWEWGDGTINNSPTPNSYKYADSGTYQIRLIATNSVGCTDEYTQTIIIANPFVLYIPNTFTPDNNKYNDSFTPKGNGIKTYNMSIYNRWGNRIYYTEDLLIGWDGRVDGNIEIAQIETYVYVINVTTEEVPSHSHAYRGTLNLVR